MRAHLPPLGTPAPSTGAEGEGAAMEGGAEVRGISGERGSGRGRSAKSGTSSCAPPSSQMIRKLGRLFWRRTHARWIPQGHWDSEPRVKCHDWRIVTLQCRTLLMVIHLSDNMQYQEAPTRCSLICRAHEPRLLTPTAKWSCQSMPRIECGCLLSAGQVAGSREHCACHNHKLAFIDKATTGAHQRDVCRSATLAPSSLPSGAL